MPETRPLAVILTALPEEVQAVRALMEVQDKQQVVKGTYYDVAEFESKKGNIWHVAVAEIGKGVETAIVETINVLNELKPDCLLFVGVAGGIKDTQIGDVVIADDVYGYEGAKVGAKQEARPTEEHAEKSLVSLARNIASKKKWQDRLESPASSPKAMVGPIATGGKVISSTKSEIYQIIKESYNDTVAVEMEGLGFLRALREAPGKPAIVIRGISDLLDKKGESDASGSQEIASAHAAAFAFELLSQYLDIHQNIKTPGEQLPVVDSPPSKEEEREPEEIDRVVINNSIIPPVTSAQRIVEEKVTPVQQMIEEHICKELEFFPDLLVLVRKKLGEQIKGETALKVAQILCHHPTPRWSLDILKDPVFDFLRKLRVEEQRKLPDAVYTVKMIIGWLLLRGVDEQFLLAQIGQPAPDQGFRLEIGLHEYAPVEVIIAFTGKRFASYETKKCTDQVYGLGAVDLNRLTEFGYRHEDQVEGIVRTVWKIVYGADRPEEKCGNPEKKRKDSQRLDKHLNAALRESGRWAKEFYCMVSGDEQDNPLNDHDVIELLRYRLPRLKMIAFGVKGKGTGMIWAGEELSEYVRNFLIALRNYR